MSIANEINILKGNIRNAYTSIQNKGGTIPTNKNTENLSSAIDSISAGGTTTLGTKTITTNGVYNASDDNLDGYSQVTVDVKTSNAWQRPTDWYDLPTILKNTENIVRDGVTYYPKMALQYISSGDSTNIYLNQYLSYPSSAGTIKYLVKTSDGQELISTLSSENITWNRENEKDTRYAILFTNKDYSVALTQISPSTETTCIEMVVGNCTIAGLLNIGANKPSFINVETLETTKFTSTTSQFANYNNNCQTVEHIYCPTVTVLNSSFGSNRLQDIDFPQLKKIGSSGTFSNSYYTVRRINFPSLETSLNATLNDLRNVKEIILPNFKNAQTNNFLGNCYGAETINLSSLETFKSETTVGLFSNAYSLTELKLKQDFKINKVNLSNSHELSKTCLIDILNKLADVTEEITTYTITLGSVNIGKLTTDELAIGTGKGWTIS